MTAAHFATDGATVASAARASGFVTMPDAPPPPNRKQAP